MTNAKKTWRELEAEGVRRCCARFNNGVRCTSRSVGTSSWCSKHSWITQAAKDLRKTRDDAERRHNG